MRLSRRRVGGAVLAAVAAAAVACAGGGDGSAAAVAQANASSPLFAASYPHYFDEASGLRTILGTPDLGVGRQRVGFVLSDERGLVRLPVARVRSYFYASGTDGPREGPVESGVARFFEFPFKVRGMYSLDLTLDRSGTWGLEVEVPRADGSTVVTSFTFPVAERALAPVVGEAVPRTRNRTQRDVGSLSELSTGRDPAPALYQMSVAEALETGRPLVVVFASPAFCTNALCGPQVELVGDLAEQYGDRANFIHIDLYENPAEIQGNLDRAVRTPILKEWGLETDEWTFVVDGAGRVAARFEAFVTRSELEEALVAVLDGAQSRQP